MSQRGRPSVSSIETTVGSSAENGAVHFRGLLCRLYLGGKGDVGSWEGMVSRGEEGLWKEDIILRIIWLQEVQPPSQKNTGVGAEE